MTDFVLNERERAIYRRYAELALPRHTSYPISPVWKADYGPAAFRSDLESLAQRNGPLSLYVHIPFCERLCYYCACTKEIVPPARRKEQDPSDALVQALELEAGRFGEVLACCDVHQVHLGGGSPTFLKPEHLERLWNGLSTHFRIHKRAEIAIEVDPRITTFEQLQLLRRLGFNRISLGIQDFSPHVQSVVNRTQPYEMVARLVTQCRELDFDSINFDLIYGLPFQTLDSMSDTLDKTIQLAPDRIAFYRLAVIPEIFRWQNTFRQGDLPAGDLSLDLNLLAINRFRQAGYEFVGLDHFAKPTEQLARARQDRTLRRNFQGMTTGKELEIIGLGPSAISQLDAAFAQNDKTFEPWQQRVQTDFATIRGMRLSWDDKLRRELLQQLYGSGVIDKVELNQQFEIDFDSYFERELQSLGELQDEGIVALDSNSISLTEPLGRLLVRVVGAVFDRYLPPECWRDGLASTLASKVG